MKSNYVFFEKYKFVLKNRKKKVKGKTKQIKEARNKGQHDLLTKLYILSQPTFLDSLHFIHTWWWILNFVGFDFQCNFSAYFPCIYMGALLITTTNCTTVIGKGSWNMKIVCEESCRKIIVTHCTTSQPIIEKKNQNKTNKF